jgi:hypothetical protein
LTHAHCTHSRKMNEKMAKKVTLGQLVELANYARKDEGGEDTQLTAEEWLTREMDELVGMAASGLYIRMGGNTIHMATEEANELVWLQKALWVLECDTLKAAVAFRSTFGWGREQVHRVGEQEDGN